MKIAFFDIQGWEKSHVRRALKEHEVLFFAEPLSLETVDQVSDCEVVSVFIYSDVSDEVMAKMPSLHCVTTRSTGYDHIDLAAARKRKICVSSVPFYGENTVAEHTFALILALSRNVHTSHVRRLRGDFSIEGLCGFDLKGKTIGVVGAGHIGLNVIKIARGFGMNVLAFDLHPDAFLAEVLDFSYASFDDVLEQSDIITLHVPYNKHTHHLISEENYVKFKRGSILINTARGELVDNDALISALDEGILSGAGLDVLDGEELIREERQLLHDPQKIEQLGELIKDHILLSKDNVVFTPHIGFYSQEALERILDTTIENVCAFCDGKPKNIVE